LPLLYEQFGAGIRNKVDSLARRQTPEAVIRVYDGNRDFKGFSDGDKNQ
jgi:hypothetical protein